MENAGKERWDTLKWVLRYLRGTSNYPIIYDGSSDLVCGYVDSDFAGDFKKRRSTSPYVFTLVGGLVIWMA